MMMVSLTDASQLHELLDDEFDSELTVARRTADRFAAKQREQPSRTRMATAARFSRKRSAKSTAPLGPRRRLRKV